MIVCNISLRRKNFAVDVNGLRTKVLGSGTLIKKMYMKQEHFDSAFKQKRAHLKIGVFTVTEGAT